MTGYTSSGSGYMPALDYLAPLLVGLVIACVVLAVLAVVGFSGRACDPVAPTVNVPVTPATVRCRERCQWMCEMDETPLPEGVHVPWAK